MHTRLKIVRHLSQIRELSRAARQRGEKIGLVPTMGALHTGHLSLAAAARRECQTVMVSIFVNPTQFAPHEDFNKYPRDLQADCELLVEQGPTIVFAPEVADLYPEHSQTWVEVAGLTQPLEGTFRPTHFRGVTTVVAKLFTACEPDYAYFGQKDFQQLRVLEQMTSDLLLPITIRRCPIVRDYDGIALSSRNRYLSPEERERGLSLSRALAIVQAMFERGERSVAEFESAMCQILAQATVQIDYATVVDQQTLSPLTNIDRPAVALIAGRVGTTRLIDNLLLIPPELSL
jgi:pantoate--beta-alanine ligase